MPQFNFEFILTPELAKSHPKKRFFFHANVFEIFQFKPN
jgi:hypothetical protein